MNILIKIQSSSATLATMLRELFILCSVKLCQSSRWLNGQQTTWHGSSPEKVLLNQGLWNL